MPKKQITKTTPAVVPPSKMEVVDEYDVQLEYSLKLVSKDGNVANVSGKLPLQGALHPVFMRESMRTIESTVDSLVKRRFLTQVRHFFNTLDEGSKTVQTAATEGVALQNGADAPSRAKPAVLELEYEEENDSSDDEDNN
jgi:hypothetical protein